jgi:hypothetical protein
MKQIPSFAEAVEGLQRLLRAEGQPGEIVWAFREDLYSISPSQHQVAWPLPPENAVHARNLFDVGRACEIVELQALFSVGSCTVANVLAPMSDEIQGWARGLKLAVRQPFVPATAVTGGLRRWTHRVRPAYFRFQRYQDFISQRDSIAREKPSNPWVEKDAADRASHPKR